MAKQATFDGEGFPDKLPKAVSDASTAYMSKMRASQRATEKANTAKEVLIEAMKDANLTKIRLEDGSNKMFERFAKENIRTVAIKKLQPEEDD
jgi:hypothetical protein